MRADDAYFVGEIYTR